ncbi:uncharacterized protein LOC135830349 [Sycon ciliatum]|uniref:uncharacterized protein LOC135830349 n=1 Tax=Sycon ciliatum TaxID=27933 RepID=UPI0031F674A6
MTRMGFGLSVAPKFMDIIVRWVTRDFPSVDNYVDDVKTPASEVDAVAARMLEYGLPTKQAEPFASSRVLGLQLQKDEDHQVQWSRRGDINLKLPRPATKRDIFSWFAGDGDPARGMWCAGRDESAGCTVWADASDVGIGVAFEMDGAILEDCSWLRPFGDKRHINIVELEAAIRGLSLAVHWQAKHVRLMTDSKTAEFWLREVIGNVRRTKTKGLHEVLVQRRLQIVADLIVTAGLSVSVEWVPTVKNRADALTRVPVEWVKRCKLLKGDGAGGDDECGDGDVNIAAAAASVSGPAPTERIVEAQRTDDEIQTLTSQLQQDIPVLDRFSAVRAQLVIVDGVLVRNVKLPLEGTVQVPVVPQPLVADVVRCAHEVSGHGCWETMYRMIRSRCYFPGIAAACCEFIAQCTRCKAANPRKGPPVSPTRADIPGRPWSEVIIDTLELGTDRSGRYSCVLVCVGPFTKWVEVCPLRRHDAANVAAAFTNLCMRWGCP